MPKAIITYEDSENGALQVKVRFEPELKVGQEEMTEAQIAGLQVVQALNAMEQEEENAE